MARIIVTRGVREYRQTIPHCVCSMDTVLEVGCAWGTTSALLQKRAGHLVAIDKGPSLLSARRKYPYIHFEQADGFDIARVLSLQLRFNKVYIDISGCRGVGDVLRMIAAYESAFAPELVVVKSTPLKRFLQRSTAWNARVTGEGAAV